MAFAGIESFFGKDFFKKIVMSKVGEAFKGAFHGDDTGGDGPHYDPNFSGLKMGISTDFRLGKAQEIQQTSYDAVRALWDKRHNTYVKSDITVTRSS